MSRSAASPLAPMIWGRHRLDWGQRTYIMGILNVTPDSFSRDGLAPEGAHRERDCRGGGGAGAADGGGWRRYAGHRR